MWRPLRWRGERDKTCATKMPLSVTKIICRQSLKGLILEIRYTTGFSARVTKLCGLLDAKHLSSKQKKCWYSNFEHASNRYLKISFSSIWTPLEFFHFLTPIITVMMTTKMMMIMNYRHYYDQLSYVLLHDGVEFSLVRLIYTLNVRRVSTG